MEHVFVADPVDLRERDDDDPAAITLRELEIARAWNVRGDPGDASFVSQVERTLGLSLPVTPMTSSSGEDDVLLWLGPRAWLYVAGMASARHDFDATRRTINAAGGAVFDVSASHVAWAISGAASARVLNRLCPLDLDPRAWARGQCAQSMLGHVNALLYRPGETASFIVLVARSLAADAWHSLCRAAVSEGYRVLPTIPFATKRARIDDSAASMSRPPG
jgi:heterotetrameric sarcosine oxidase gamma subunit